MITINAVGYEKLEKFVKNGKIQKKLNFAHESLRSLDKSNGTGWVDLPSETNKQEILSIKTIAKEIQDKCDLFLVVGIGGSYAGANACIDVLKKSINKTEVKFVGTSFCAKELQSELEDAKHREVCVNVISKSGNTTETLLAFHLIEEFMKKKYKKGEYKSRIFVTTDYEVGYLRDLAIKENYKMFIIPRTIGGRYSVFTSVGLLPMAVAGLNIEKLINGAKVAELKYSELSIEENLAYKYAMIRYFLHTKHKKFVEVIASFDSSLNSYFEWQKQLFAESEGKDGKGLFVASLNYPKDLHSFGQYIQDGSPILFETIISIKNKQEEKPISGLKENHPLFALNGKSFASIEKATEDGVISAHKKAGVPIIKIEVEELTEESIGEFLYFMMIACAISSYMLGVNPFDQPGVEQYKKETRENLNI